MENSFHVVGDGGQPVLICQKKEIPKLFDSKFWYIWEVWQYFHEGFGLPGNRPWDKQEPELMNYIMLMERHYKRNFSEDSVKLKYIEAIIKRMDVYFGKRKR